MPREFLNPCPRRVKPATFRLRVPAGLAAPRVISVLAIHGINLTKFCKEFNARTEKCKPGTPMPTTVYIAKDSTFEFSVNSPSVPWFLKKAAGIERASKCPGHLVVSNVTLKHVYEIAKIKHSDPSCPRFTTLESICKSIIATANRMGIQVVKDFD